MARRAAAKQPLATSTGKEWVMKLKFWLRWAERDLRQRWLQVGAIALIIALGTGIYAGLGSMESWRIDSLDESYGMLNMYDLRLSMTPGSSLPQAEAVDLLSQVAGITAVEPRLLLDTQVEVVGSEPEILVVGQIMGAETRDGGPHVNQTHIEAGRGLSAADSSQALLEFKFASHHNLETGAQLLLGGGLEVEVVGLGQMPEYFLVTPPGGFQFVMGEASFAAVVLPLATVQTHYQQPGQINDLLFLLEDQADRAAVQLAIEETMADSFPGAGITINTREEDPVHNLLYSDAVEDQVMLNFFAIILLIGASLAAFNLAGRIVESQRRQIGISMALGVPRSWIAVRPLLMGLQIAFLGMLLGLALGLLFGRWLGDLTMELAPLPYWSETILHWSSFLLAAMLGILLPVLATLIPVWQAVHMPPLEAIHGHLIARSSGLNRWLKGVRLPGNTFSQMPLKNVLRSVRRSGLMILGIVTAVILLTLFLGLLDTFVATLNQAETALLHRSPHRLTVNLTTFYPTDYPQVENIAGLTTEDGRPLFAEVEKGLLLFGRLRAEGADVEEAVATALEYFDPDSPIWTPALTAGTLSNNGDRDMVALVISQKMAEDWGLAVGDTAVLEHPRREGLMGVKLVESQATITGIHDNPIRSLSFVDRTQAPFTGLEIATNILTVIPHTDIEPELVRRTLFAQPGVASVQTVAEIVTVFDEALELVTAMLRVIQGVVVVLAFLIAYNATSINIDDRKREIAAMFAFGLRPRTVLRVQMGENLLLGAAGTLIGLALGYLMLHQFMAARMESMFENLGLVVSVAPFTMALIILLCTGVVALTPLVNFRRLQRINIPDTLRVME
jgi:putative ABC transport system permease protein